MSVDATRATCKLSKKQVPPTQFEGDNIEKFTGSMNHEESGCTILINKTLDKLLDYETLGLYTYLSSRPQNWKITIKDLMSRGKCGRDKVYKLLNNLKDSKVLERVDVHDISGKFIESGYKLYLRPVPEILNQPFPEFQETVQKQPFPEIQETVTSRSSIGSQPFPDLPYPVNTEAYKTYIVPLQIKEKTSTNTFVISDIYDDTLLRQRITFPCHLEMSDNEFLLMCKFAIENNPKKKELALGQLVAGVCTLMFQRRFDIPPAFKACLEQKEQVENLISDYQEFVSKMKADINLKLLATSTKIPSFDEWKGSMNKRRAVKVGN